MADDGQRLAALQEVALAVNASLEPDRVLALILDHGCRLLGTRHGSVMLLDADQRLVIKVAHGLPAHVIAATRVPLGEGVAGGAAQSGQTRVLPAGTVERDGRRVRLPAALCVPLLADGQVLGVLNLSDRRAGGEFGDDDRTLAELLGAQAALALRNARLFEGVRARADALAALNDIGRALSGSLRRDEVLQRVLDSALRLLRCTRGSLMLVSSGDDDGGAPHLRIVVAQGLPTKVVVATRTPLGEGIAGRVALTGKLEVLAEGAVDARSVSRQRSGTLCLPLKAKEHVVGVLNLSGHDGGDFEPDEVELGVTLAAQAAAAIENAQLYDDLQDQFVHSIRVIANAIDARDPYTRGHSERVAAYALLIATELGLDEEQVEDIYHAGLLHDVGKIGIRDNILLKDGRLTDEEFQVMKLHPVKSEEIILPVKQLRAILPGLRHHHERFSALGYPDGLHEHAIPLQARVIGVADTYDAMTSDRPYRKALPRRVALEELVKNRGLQFDPACVNAFLAVVANGSIAAIDGQGESGAEDVAAALAAVERAGSV